MSSVGHAVIRLAYSSPGPRFPAEWVFDFHHKVLLQGPKYTENTLACRSRIRAKCKMSVSKLHEQAGFESMIVVIKRESQLSLELDENNGLIARKVGIGCWFEPVQCGKQ